MSIAIEQLVKKQQQQLYWVSECSSVVLSLMNFVWLSMHKDYETSLDEGDITLKTFPLQTWPESQLICPHKWLVEVMQLALEVTNRGNSQRSQQWLVELT